MRDRHEPPKRIVGADGIGKRAAHDENALVRRLEERAGAGRETGAGEQKREWQMRQELRTPRYTTNLADIPIARA